MNQQITINVSEQVIQRAAQIAARMRGRTEDVLASWLESFSGELPVGELSDVEVLALTEAKLSDEQQMALSDLLEKNREGLLEADSQKQLDELIRVYEQGLLRKSQALREAVKRGLIAPLQA